MPISHSAKKALRRDRRRLVVNRKITALLKKQLKTFRLKPDKENLAKAYRAIDRAAKKRVLHPNKGARLKSRLTVKPL